MLRCYFTKFLGSQRFNTGAAMLRKTGSATSIRSAHQPPVDTGSIDTKSKINIEPTSKAPESPLAKKTNASGNIAPMSASMAGSADAISPNHETSDTNFYKADFYKIYENSFNQYKKGQLNLDKNLSDAYKDLFATVNIDQSGNQSQSIVKKPVNLQELAKKHNLDAYRSLLLEQTAVRPSICCPRLCRTDMNATIDRKLIQNTPGPAHILASQATSKSEIEKI